MICQFCGEQWAGSGIHLCREKNAAPKTETEQARIRRETATAILAGLAMRRADRGYGSGRATSVERAVAWADALLAQLEKKP